MTATTAFDTLPRLVAFDRELAAFSASTINRILDFIGRDKSKVHHDIVKHALKFDSKDQLDDAHQHAMLQAVEYAGKKPQDFRDLITKGRWRYFFTRICTQQFQSTRSDWRPFQKWNDKRQSVDGWNDGSALMFDDGSGFDRLATLVQHAEPAKTLEDLWTIADPSKGAEGEYSRFLHNLSILFRQIDWPTQRLFALYHFDLYDFLKEEQKTKPKAKMTYRLIAKYTKIDFRAVHAAVKRAEDFIRQNYERQFGEPIPRHLLKKFSDN